MSYFKTTLLIAGLATLSVACSAEKDSSEKKRQSPPTTGNSNDKNLWTGSCPAKPSLKVLMNIVGDVKWAMQVEGGKSESGSFAIGDDGIAKFYLEDSKSQIMTCEQDGELGHISCNLDPSNKIAFFDDCSIAKFVYSGPKDAPASTTLPPNFFPTSLPAEEKVPPRIAGKSATAGEGVCGTTPLTLQLLANGSFLLKSSDSSPFNRVKNISGSYFETANANEVELFDGFYVKDGQPQDAIGSIMTCSLPGAIGASPTGVKCLVKTASQARIGCLDLDFEG